MMNETTELDALIVINPLTKSWIPGTKIYRSNGELVEVQLLREDDQLMGTDGTVRYILPNTLFHSSTMMYEIVPDHEGAVSFTVNGDNILNLVCNYMPSITVDNRRRGGGFLVLNWVFVPTTGLMMKRTVGNFPTLAAAQRKLNDLSRHYQYIEMTVQRYLTLPTSGQQPFNLYQAGPVEFISTQSSLLRQYLVNYLQVTDWGGTVDDHLLNLTMWMTGMWLSDGTAQSAHISQSPYQDDNGTVSHTEIINSMEEWGQLVGNPMISLPCTLSTNGNRRYRYSFLRCPGVGSTQADPYNNLLLLVLTYFGFMINKPGTREPIKAIPVQWLLSESIPRRKAFFAGVVDGDAYLRDDQMYEISAKERVILEELCVIGRSLDFRNLKIGEKICIDKHGNSFKGYRTFFAGRLNELTDVKLPYKRAQTLPRSLNPNSYRFHINPVGVKDCCSFQVDGNGKVLLEDFAVT